MFLHIITTMIIVFIYYVLPTLFLLVNTFLLILHVFNIAFMVFIIIIIIIIIISLPTGQLGAESSFKRERETNYK